MLDLLETLLTRCGIQNFRYDGKMQSETCDAALVAFRKTGGPRMVLITIKCSNVGLNFTTANRLIKYVATSTSSEPSSDHTHCMDLSWNFTAESQAHAMISSVVPGKKRICS
jgi:hypothetical protein